MSLDIRATNKYWLIRARLAGTPARLTDLPSRSMGFDKARSTCRLVLADVPSQVAGDNAIVDVGWNGRTERFFTGEVESSGADNPSLSRTVQCTDVLRRLKYATPTAMTWSNVDFPDAVAEVLEAAGIVTGAGLIYDPGLTLGAEYPVVIDTSEPLERVLSDLLAYGGCKVWVTPAGLARVDNVTPVPASSYASLPDGTTLIYAADPAGDELGIIRSSQQLGAPDQLVSSVTITGPTRADGITPTGNATLDITGVPYNQELRFVQSGTDAETIAQRELDRRAANRRWLTVEVPFNPYVLPGQTIGFRDPLIGFTSTTPALVWSVDSQGPRMNLRLVVGAHVDTGYSELIPPVAIATVTIEQQPILVSGTSVVRYFVQVDGRQSYDPDGTIMLYDWTASGGTPTSADTAQAMFIYPSLTDETITLTVTDDQDQTGSITLTLDDPSNLVLRRQLLVAEGSAGLAFLNDGENWQSFTRDSQECTAVPTFNEVGSLYSGWDDGGIWKINDALADIEEVQTLAGGSVGVIYVNDQDGLNVLAGVGTKLYRAVDGATFTEVNDFDPDIVNDAQSSGFNVNEIRVAVGNALKLSFDGGTNWTDVITGETGSICEMIASAPWGNAAVFSTGTSTGMDEDDALKFEESTTVDWSGVGSPPTSLTMISPFWSTEGYFVGADDGQQFKLSDNGSGFTAELIDTAGTSNETSDGIRDGALESLAFLALSGGTDPGTYKILNKSALYQVRANDAYSIGYGVLGTITPYRRVNALVYWPTSGTASSGIWRRSIAGTWTLIPFPHTGTYYFYGIEANRTGTALLVVATTNTGAGTPYRMDIDASDIIRMPSSAYSPLWHLDLVSETWTEIELESPAPGPRGAYDFIFSSAVRVCRPHWSPSSDNNWMLTNEGDDGYGRTGKNAWWRGTGTTPTPVTTESGYDQPWAEAAIAGVSADIVSVGAYDFYVRYVAPAASASTLVGTATTEGPFRDGQMARISAPGSKGIVMVPDGGGDLYYTSDYRTTGMTSVVSNVGRYVCAAAHGVYVGGRSGGLDGVLRVLGLGGSASSGVVAAGGTETGYIRSDRQTGYSVAAKVPDGLEITTDGATWSTIDGPPSTDVAAVFEVVAV